MDSEGNRLTDTDIEAASLTVHDLSANADIACVLRGQPSVQSGTFDIVIECSSDSPTASPTTPAPTHPGELICGSESTGSFNGDAIEFEVRMPYAGDMMVDMSGSDFDIASITCSDFDI